MSFNPKPEIRRENSTPQRPRGHHVRNRLSISTATAALSMTDSEPAQPPSPTTKGDITPGGTSAASRAKKKKGQKFYCQGFGDCNLSFTRSEHLLRHIRYVHSNPFFCYAFLSWERKKVKLIVNIYCDSKHTGERPFTCHCGRAFSRLDNLRQHSQTVHADEVIPADSLAATGTRYQRHVKTDRLRPAGRARSSTTGSNGEQGPDDGDEMDFEADSPQSSVEEPPSLQPQSKPSPAPITPVASSAQVAVAPPPQQQKPKQLQQQAQPKLEENSRPKARPRSLLLNQRLSQNRTVAFQDNPVESPAKDGNPYFKERELTDRYHPHVPPYSSAMSTPSSATFPTTFSPLISPSFSSFSGHGASSPLASPIFPFVANTFKEIFHARSSTSKWAESILRASNSGTTISAFA